MEEKVLTLKFCIHADSLDFEVKDRELIRCAQKAQAYSYAPYSGFRVGVALRMTNGALLGHGNLENASYSLCLCAERSALAAAAVQYPETVIESLVVSASAEHQMVSPCGACRQVICETETRQNHPIRVIIQGDEGQWLAFERAKDLLPFPFGPGNLLG